MLNSFWKWYERNYHIIAPLTALLFLLQIVHLIWLTTDVVFLKAFGASLWNPGELWTTVIALVDYTEMPAIITASLLYIHQIRAGKGKNWKNILYLLFINSQWLHLFWITDEVIYKQFTGETLVLIPIWLAWCAIIIDYFELPVIYDTIKKAIKSLQKRD